MAEGLGRERREWTVAVRIKAHWHDDEVERSLDEIAGALAFITWRLATDKAITLHGEDFVYDLECLAPTAMAKACALRLLVIAPAAFLTSGITVPRQKAAFASR